MVHQSYISDWEREEHTAFGKKLCPFTLGHARVLYLAENPLVTGQGSAGLDDILQAVCICSMPEAPARDQLGEIIRQADGFSAFDAKEECRQFSLYLAYWLKPVPRFTKSHEQRAPWPWLLVSRLMMEFRYLEPDAWKENIAKALWLTACSAISAGDETYATIDEQRTIEMMTEDG